MDKKANLFLVSAPRTGSTQLSFWLASHPEIAMPNIKEPNFFSNSDFSEEYVSSTHLNDVDPEKYVNGKMRKVYQFCIFRTQEQYKKLFESIAGAPSWRLDGSTTYLQSPGAAEKIKRYNENAKVVILLRDPIKRMISHYGLAVRMGREARSFRDCFMEERAEKKSLGETFLINQSLYSRGVSDYFNVFPKENIFLVFFEDLIADPRGELSRIADFLSVDPNGFDLSREEKNESSVPRFGRLNVFLQSAGIKTFLRSLLPRAVKKMIKNVYFKKEKVGVDFSGCDFSPIYEDIRELDKIYPGAAGKWKCR